jgi:DNA mismatch endonuclease, patch repair protein
MKKSSKTRNYLGRDFQKKRSSDKLSIKRRSELMSKIRSKDTKLEVNFIELLRKQTKYRFLTHQRDIKGNPDIVFKSKKVCVFIDSDFWHGWQFPRWKNMLKNDFWKDKINNNRRRDRKITAHLRKKGWNVVRIWEHEIKKDIDGSVEIIKSEIDTK